MNIILYTLSVTHLTIICVTLYLHRSQSHRSVTFHPIISHFMRFWLWLTTGMVTKEWVAIHRKHHAFSDKQGDPHSPIIYGLKRILLFGAFCYHEASKDPDMVKSYGKGTPDDWIENYYTKYNYLGILIILWINIFLFGAVGWLVWLVQMVWIPFWAAGIINGLAHFWGYKNGETRDNSKNISPIGFIIGGEELHNNHHLDPGSAKLSRKWYEFDIGWFYIKILYFLRLAKLKDTNKKDVL